MKLLDRVHNREFRFRIDPVLIGLIDAGNLIVPNASIDLREEAQPVVLEATPRELLIWDLLGGQTGRRSPLKLRVSQIPALIERLSRVYRNTDPEDYGQIIDLLEILETMQDGNER